MGADDTIMCWKCMKDVSVRDAIAGKFCSLECQQRHVQMVAVNLKRRFIATPSIAVPAIDAISVNTAPILEDMFGNRDKSSFETAEDNDSFDNNENDDMAKT